MVSPYFIEGQLKYATKKGLNVTAESAQKFVENSSVDYNGFSIEWIEKGKNTRKFQENS